MVSPGQRFLGRRRRRTPVRRVWFRGGQIDGVPDWHAASVENAEPLNNGSRPRIALGLTAFTPAVNPRLNNAHLPHHPSDRSAFNC